MENKNGSLILFLFLIGSVMIFIIGALFEVPGSENRLDSKITSPIKYSEEGSVKYSEGHVKQLESPFGKR